MNDFKIYYYYKPEYPYNSAVGYATMRKVARRIYVEQITWSHKPWRASYQTVPYRKKFYTGWRQRKLLRELYELLEG